MTSSRGSSNSASIRKRFTNDKAKVMAKQPHDVFGDGSPTSSVRGLIPTKWPTKIANTTYNEKYMVAATHQPFIRNRMHSNPNLYYSIIPPIQRTVDLHIHGVQLHPLLVLNKDGSTKVQASKEVLKDKSKKEAAEDKEVVVVVATTQQKEAEIQESIRTMAQLLQYMFGEIPHTYTPRKRLCDVFGDQSNTSRPIRTVKTTYNEKDQGVDVAYVTLEEGVGDSFTDEQVGDNVVLMVKYHCPDLKFLPPPEEDDEDMYV
ncbi:hypothetical protein KY290_011008 [Solanum tuberosum]|uniref:Integrase core domain containing protein n=1 Tax=Solanum tuberosum TaxID=4113 RepID=A0ABQ7VZG5_SOLTU|nr:hypothetical protein KY290_011008 [Solanum tuberosum]